jgi:hypothetical protein
MCPAGLFKCTHRLVVSLAQVSGACFWALTDAYQSRRSCVSLRLRSGSLSSGRFRAQNDWCLCFGPFSEELEGCLWVLTDAYLYVLTHLSVPPASWPFLAPQNCYCVGQHCRWPGAPFSPRLSKCAFSFNQPLPVD